MLDGLAGEMRGELVPPPAAAPMFLHDDRVSPVRLGRSGRLGRGRRGIEQLQLIGIDPFAAGTVLAAEQLLDVVLQLLHALLQAGDRGLLLLHDLVAEPDIIGMRGGIRAHVAVKPHSRARGSSQTGRNRRYCHEWCGDSACGAWRWPVRSRPAASPARSPSA